MSQVVVTGGAGFLGSHLCDRLIERGHVVVCVDNLSTSTGENVAHLAGHPSFEFVLADICEGLTVEGPVTAIAHLASPASPPEYLSMPLETLAVLSKGTEAVLELAAAHSARVVLASTSEVYGDPLIHPQPEGYWGNVNPIGPRSVYDEGKRFSEALVMAHHRVRDINVGIVRIFNTYGPRLRPLDGRVVSNFIAQAITGQPLTIYGSGEQTRSFCYVDDLIDGLVRIIHSDVIGPINLGNPQEMPILGLARLVCELTGSASPIVHHQRAVDDPWCRRPEINQAAELLGWSPQISLTEGLVRTINWQRSLSTSRVG